MYDLNSLLNLSTQEEAITRYAKILLVNVTETFRHIVDKDVSFNNAKTYNSIFALLCVIWANKNIANNFFEYDNRASGIFILDITIVKGKWLVDENTSVEHEWVDVGGNPLVIACPKDYKEREKRTLLDIGPYLEERIERDKKTHKPTSILTMPCCEERFKQSIILKGGENITISAYAKRIFDQSL